jgi:predicted nucleotidyltransferase
MMDFDLYSHTSLLCRSGSRLYGINNADSDIDVQGCAVPPVKYWLSNLEFEQSNDAAKLQDARFMALFTDDERKIIAATKLEGTIYGVKKYIHLAGESNPNVLDGVWAPDSAVLRCDRIGELIRENQKLFLTLSALPRFVGYSVGQLKKMNLHRQYFANPRLVKPERANYNLNAPDDYTPNELDALRAAIKKQVDSWQPSFTDKMSQVDIIAIKDHFSRTLEEMSIAQEDRYLLAERRLGVPGSLKEYFEKERRFQLDMDAFKDYQKWLKDRNPARAALEAKVGYDTKFAVHLIRLLRACCDILRTGTYMVDRTNIDAELLREIRAGNFKYEDILAMSDALKVEAFELGKLNPKGLPQQPQHDKINDLLVNIAKSSFGWN